MVDSNQARDELNRETASRLITPVRFRNGAILVMAASVLVALIPGVAIVERQILLLVGVLAGAACFGLAVGLSAATLGLVLILRGDFRTAGSLAAGPVIEAIIWFAVAKFAAALVALQRKQYLGERAARQQAEASASQQTLLLREMTHRTRNDMQRLIGMLNAQARTNPAASSALHQAASRVLVQTRLNERLAMRGSQTLVESRAFLDELGNDLRSVIELGRLIGITISAESHLLVPAAAADIGLIVNELVTNALKHGFPGSVSGVIRVVFRRVGEHQGLYELLVSDNGVGPVAVPDSNGLGQNLLRALASQLGGRITVSRGEVGGTQCRLLFPVHPSSPPIGDVTLPPDEFEALHAVGDRARTGSLQQPS